MSIARARDHVRAEQRRFRRAQAGRSWKIRDLPQYYYLTNFNDFLKDVHALCFDLLGQAELDFLSGFAALPRDAQATYVRMANRRGYVFDRDRFVYDEIEAQDRQWDRLIQSGFAEPIGPLLFRDWLSSLAKPDLALTMADSMCETLFRKSWKKDRLVDLAATHIDPHDAYVSDRYIGQGRRDVLQYMLFLYFGRIEDNLQVLTHRDLGLVRLPESRPTSPDYDAVEDAKTAYFYAQALHDFRKGTDRQSLALCESVQSWPEPVCERSTGHRDKLLQKLGGWAERRGDLEVALTLYGRSDAPLCNERVVRIRWNRDDDGDRAWCRTRLEGMIENPASDQEVDFAGDFYSRKFRKKRTSATTDLLRTATTLTLDEAYRSQPERAALHHYKAQGMTAYRTENVPWRNLFGLLFWDLLHHGQDTRRRVPAKLRNGGFYGDYREEIERRLGRLDQPSVIMLDLLRTLSVHYGEDNALVHWGSRSLDRIQALILHSPRGAVAAMLRSMAQDWIGTKDGFPDLMLIDDGRVRFVEIKTAGDSIRRNQLTRLRQLTQAGYAIQIVKVNWAVDPDQPYVVVDVETTGGRPGLHRLTEIGAVRMIGGEIVAEFQTLLNPQRSIPPNITRITGIDNAMVASAPHFIEVAERFREFMGDSIFAAHNVNFDYGFISAEYEMIDQRFRHPKICTCASMRRLYPGHRSYSLKNLCREFEIDLKQHHRALCDAKAAAELLKLVNEKRMAD
ncbi:exonuclease domain-containing protein [uncultured Algimonas sp.]|uniref:exonuclease domain-containing protein n=1 Tax=uncultured Algimonas sp. TaxID=1547920 RepID=UPI0026268123|nr:exonuclease domain-containing protein [uncultured Algimonas sp.]